MRRRRKPRRRSYRHARNLSINFLKRPAQKDLLAETRLVKLGKRIAVADIAIRSVSVPGIPMKGCVLLKRDRRDEARR
jgi:acyl-coenzyme A thioesterase PaaI-like protein